MGETVLYGLSITIAPAVFGAVGAVTSQLGRTRRVATGLGMGVFGVVFVIRMIADSSAGTRWLLWATPFGWTELMRPFTDNDPWPLCSRRDRARAVRAADRARRRAAMSAAACSRRATCRSSGPSGSARRSVSRCALELPA